MTVTLKNKKPLVVPDRVRREAGFKNGDRVEFKVSRGAVTILPKPPVIKDSDDILTPDEAKIVRRGEAQLKRGKSKPWRVVKHALER
jgi:bifunctional DNA-binding transcriptional regulator/antitoxin component of YhaV-PrlF toxin-antitoxin module